MLNKWMISMSIVVMICGGIFLSACQGLTNQAQAKVISANPIEPYPIELSGELQNALNDWRQINNIVGVSMAVHSLELGEIVLSSGLADLEAEVTLMPHHQLYAVSVTKPFVAASILQLIEAEQLDFNDTLSQWYPDFPNADEITIRQMLNMTSGTFDYFRASPDNPILPLLMSNLDHVWTPEETIKFVAELEPTAQPGTLYDYSNTNYIFLGRIIEDVTGNTLATELRNRFFTPLGMDSTYLSGVQAHPETLIHGYAREYAFIFESDEALVDSTGKLTAIETISWAAGGIITTPGDLARFSKALFSGKLMSEATITDMVTPGPLQSPEATTPYGLGVEVHSTVVGPAFGHSGSMPGGFSALMLYVPEHKIAVVVMSNDEQAEPLLTALVDEILNTVVHSK